MFLLKFYSVEMKIQNFFKNNFESWNWNKLLKKIFKFSDNGIYICIYFKYKIYFLFHDIDLNVSLTHVQMENNLKIKSLKQYNIWRIGNGVRFYSSILAENSCFTGFSFNLKCNVVIHEKYFTINKFLFIILIWIYCSYLKQTLHWRVYTVLRLI